MVKRCNRGEKDRFEIHFSFKIVLHVKNNAY